VSEILYGDRLAPEQWREIEAGEDKPFGEDGLQWRDVERSVALREDGVLVAHVGLSIAEIEAGARRLPVVGFGGVIVTRRLRGTGVMRRVMEPALERAAALGPDHAMLFCSEANGRRYARFGFARIDAPVYAEQPTGRVRMPEQAMWRPLREGATWPSGDVRVLGLPF
jgi:predicted N-acetyltransferase YhbS